MNLYAIPSHQCNLSCPHCHLKDSPEKYNRELFLNELNNFDGRIVLFGGEPTFHRDRMFDIINENRKHGKNKIGSIATNLMILDDELIKFYKEIHYVSSSWNLSRFTDSQYEIWLNNINRLSNETDIYCGIIITMTEDLIDSPLEDFLKVVNQWNKQSIKFIRFEHYIGNNVDGYYQRVDNWLCDLYRKWVSDIFVETFDPKHQWYYDCKDTYTLQPDGIMTNSCPNGLYVTPKVPNECLTCQHSETCRPCRLQQGCSCPINLRNLLKER